MSFWQGLTHSLGLLSGVSDEDLMAKVKYDDNRGAFRALFERHHKAVFARLIRMGIDNQLAEEIVQDVFLSVFRSRQTYRDESAFRPWITVMARNRFIDLHRAHATKPLGQGSDIDNIIDESDSLEVALIKKEERDVIEKGLASLKSTDRELVVLWIDDFSYEEISQVVGKSVAAVKFALHQAKKKLIEHGQNRNEV